MFHKEGISVGEVKADLICLPTIEPEIVFHGPVSQAGTFVYSG